uniref:Uncharacterized protein n=1 Tax=Chromera velia CCMP2878 TaxID=1169474 RepID=A0A0G4I8U8_9ALVE|eukprot:Cvel_11984.t1-p1 / transcript=Cvel_11984.t1 / gene=Cvel_11984 / organism=Chromera_velia_CCMP2878 / gene_product=hypothetical protein / transcript_product=hypothetical protein / location=Cvel_scaffold768:57780-60762(-) / protein_length=520 / sequence_SO=supercontig / SO=protein_coding / is_pseudo=false
MAGRGSIVLKGDVWTHSVSMDSIGTLEAEALQTCETAVSLSESTNGMAGVWATEELSVNGGVSTSEVLFNGSPAHISSNAVGAALVGSLQVVDAAEAAAFSSSEGTDGARHLQETWIGNNIGRTISVNGPGALNWVGGSYAGDTIAYMTPTFTATTVAYAPAASARTTVAYVPAISTSSTVVSRCVRNYMYHVLVTAGTAPAVVSTPATTTVTHTPSATTTISVPQGSYAPIQTSRGVMIGDNGPSSSIVQDFGLPGSAPAAPVTAVAPATGAAASMVLLAPAPAVAYPARPATAPSLWISPLSLSQINPMMMPCCRRNFMGSCCTALNGRRLQEEEGAEGVVVPDGIPATTPETLAETETGAPAEVQVVDPPVETPVDEMDKQVWYGDNFCSNTTNYHGRGRGSGGGSVWYGDNYGRRTVNYYGRRLQGQEAVTESNTHTEPHTDTPIVADTPVAVTSEAAAPEEETEKQTWYGNNFGSSTTNYYGRRRGGGGGGGGMWYGDNYGRHTMNYYGRRRLEH